MNKCLVVGGTSGIGQAAADVLGPNIIAFTPGHAELDVTSRIHMERYVNVNGPFDYIVYSAGVNQLCWASAPEIDDVLMATLDVNVSGFISLVGKHAAAWPAHKVSAVAISSDAADVPMRGSVAYCASKAALNMAIKTLARELAPKWRINGVAPGMVEGTAMTEYIDKAVPLFRGWTQEYARDYERSSVPTGRRATLGEVAETVRWVLLGPDQLTGTIVKINGGKN